MSKNYIRVFAPATVANVTCGFDVLGFALEEPGDEVELYLRDEPGVVISDITGDNGKLPWDPDKNTASIALKYLVNKFTEPLGFELKIHKKMPVGSGMGSSAASAVAGVFAANELLGRPFSTKEVLRFAVEGERVICGSGHADNVAPCLYGGFTAVRSNDPLDVFKVPSPANLRVVVVHPKIEIKTADARDILPEYIPLEVATKQWANMAGLIAGLTLQDFDLMGRSMHDFVAEPVRANLIPGYHEIKEAALTQGAIGFGISGSGPSMFAFCNDGVHATQVGEAMAGYYLEQEIDHTTYFSHINQMGPKVLASA